MFVLGPVEQRSHRTPHPLSPDATRPRSVEGTAIGGRGDTAAFRLPAETGNSLSRCTVRPAAVPPVTGDGRAVAAGIGQDGALRCGPSGLDERRFHRVVAFMASHLEDDVDTADLAAVACLSVFHFTRMFGLRTGLPPYRYLSALRLEKAKQLLAMSDRSICDIAFAFGFSNQTNFTRAFRRHTGWTPGEFRRLSR